MDPNLVNYLRLATKEDDQRRRNRMAQRRHREKQRARRDNASATSGKSNADKSQQPQVPSTEGDRRTSQAASWEISMKGDLLEQFAQKSEGPSFFLDSGMNLGLEHAGRSRVDRDSGAEHMDVEAMDHILASIDTRDWRTSQEQFDKYFASSSHAPTPPESIHGNVKDARRNSPCGLSLETEHPGPELSHDEKPRPTNLKTGIEIQSLMNLVDGTLDIPPESGVEQARTNHQPKAPAQGHSLKAHPSRIETPWRLSTIAAPPPTPHETLESRFERILEIVEEAGFDSIDSMVTTYYTAVFPECSAVNRMQSTSRTRGLRSLLSTLSQSYRGWAEREKTAYREEIARSAGEVYCDELAALSLATSSCRGGLESSSGSLPTPDGGDACNLSGQTSIVATRDFIVNRIRSVLSDPGIAQFLKQDRAVIQDKAYETWSLMTELAKTAGLSTVQRAQTACVAFYLLMSPQKGATD